jgi:Mor family transcriptional regulator
MPSNDTKGIRAYQDIINYFLALDRERGASFDQLAKLYRLDKSNIRKRIKKYQDSDEATQNHNR